MGSEDQYVERTPDLVAKIRAMREAADKAMDRFRSVADYDVRRVVGQGAKPAPVSSETVSPCPASERQRKPASLPSPQTSTEFAPAPAERADSGESA
jgi:hypothetical protein